MTDHDSARKNFTALVAGTLSKLEETTLRAHLNDCPDCARELQRWQRLTASMDRLPDPPLPADLVAKIAALASTRREEILAKRQARWLWILMALFSLATSLLTWQLCVAAGHWTNSWTGWQLPAGIWPGYLLWTMFSWASVGGLLPLLRTWNQYQEGDPR